MFSKWILSVLLNYLKLKEIIAMDSAICNKSDRKTWLECIVQDFGSVSTKIQPYLCNGRAMEWCFVRGVKFIDLDLTFYHWKVEITYAAASHFATCCLNMTNFTLGTKCGGNLISWITTECIKLRIINLSGTIPDDAFTALVSRNYDLEEIYLYNTEMSNAVLFAIATNCHNLRKISLDLMPNMNDEGILALASANHDLKSLSLKIIEDLTDIGFVALVTSIPHLEELRLENCPRLTSVSLQAIASNCHNLRRILLSLDYVNDSDIMVLVQKNCNLIEIIMGSILDDDSLIMIIDSCPNLKVLWYVDHLSDSVYDYIREKCPRLIFIYCPDAIYPDYAWYLNDDESDPCPEQKSYFLAIDST